MAIPTYVLHLQPGVAATPQDAALAAVQPLQDPPDPSLFTARLEHCNDDGTYEVVVPAPGDGPLVGHLPAGWEMLSAAARLAPGSPPPGFADLWFDLWGCLPEPIRRSLAPVVADRPARIVLCAGGDSAAVPWELLATSDAWPTSRDRDSDWRTPFLRGQWQLLRRPPGVLRPAQALDADRRALLVVGSLRLPPDKVDPCRDVHRIVTAMRKAGFDVTVAAGRQLDTVAAPHGVDVNEWLDELARIARLLREGGYTLFHYVGHSHEAKDPASALEARPRPFGGDVLRVEIAGSEHRLAATELAAAIADSTVRCAVFSACDLREAFASALLLGSGATRATTGTPLEHVLSMGAPVPIAVCAEWSQGFYESLREQPSVAVAAGAGIARLYTSEIGRLHAWLPQHWSSTDVDLTFADDERVLIERVCRRVLDQLDTFEGRFRRRLDPARLAQVFVDLYIDPPRDKAKARPAGETVDERDVLPADARFEHLLELAHTRHILLGGAPGAGKSTTLRICARRLAENRQRPGLPLFVSLVDWLPAPKGDAEPVYPHLLDHLAHTLATGADETERLLQALRRRGLRGDLVVFLDGLDELSEPARGFLDKELAALRSDFALSRTVVSSRRYEHSVRLRGFVPFDIRPLTPERAAELLVRVLRTNARTKATADNVVTEEWLPRFACGPRTWQDLGKVPLFVTLVGELLIHDRKPGNSRVAFFAEVFDHLCLDQHHGVNVDPLRLGVGPRPLIATPVGDKRDPKRLRARVDAALDVLAHLALRMTEGCALTATRYELVAWIEAGGKTIADMLELADVATDDVVSSDPGAFLDAVARLTLILAPDVTHERVAADEDRLPWRFWHRSFQEVLTARRLFQDLAAGMRAAEVVERMRLEAAAEEVEAARVGLLAKWRADSDAFWNDKNSFDVGATAQEKARIDRHRSSDGQSWKKESLREELAGMICRAAANRALRDFWIEPASLMLALVVEKRGALDGGWDDAEAFLEELLRRDHGLGRRVTEALDRCPASLLARALTATSRSDREVAGARDGIALHHGLTLSLSERRPLYHAAASSTVEPQRLAETLRKRAATSDDPGELFLIDEALAALAPCQGALAARIALRSRFGRPSAASYRDHFMRLDGGAFVRGFEQGPAHERPLRQVALSPFAIGRTAVTVAMFREFFPAHRMDIGKGVVRLAECRGEIEGERVDHFPVTYVSWWAAQMFCRWLSWYRDDLLGGFPGWGPCLPTEAEWEFAARGGTASAYSFGDDEALLERHGWFADNSDGRPHAVARRLRNPFGLFDVHGGVWEWCLDAYQPYRSGREILHDPLARGHGGAPRVLRGGSYHFPAADCRSACRYRNYPDGANGDFGFRVVLAARSMSESATAARSH